MPSWRRASERSSSRHGHLLLLPLLLALLALLALALLLLLAEVILLVRLLWRRHAARSAAVPPRARRHGGLAPFSTHGRRASDLLMILRVDVLSHTA